METEVVNKNESEHRLESLLSEKKALQDKLSQLVTEMKLKVSIYNVWFTCMADGDFGLCFVQESEAIVSQQEFESETHSKLRQKSREIETLQSKLEVRIMLLPENINPSPTFSLFFAPHDITGSNTYVQLDLVHFITKSMIICQYALDCMHTPCRERLEMKRLSPS